MCFTGRACEHVRIGDWRHSNAVPVLWLRSALGAMARHDEAKRVMGRVHESRLHGGDADLLRPGHGSGKTQSGGSVEPTNTATAQRQACGDAFCVRLAGFGVKWLIITMLLTSCYQLPVDPHI